MATFLGIHDMGGSITNDKMGANWDAYKAACDKLGCSAIHVHYSAAQGRAFCLTEADSAEQVQKAHDAANVPLKELLQVQTAQ
jgi:hypothetical protein